MFYFIHDIRSASICLVFFTTRSGSRATPQPHSLPVLGESQHLHQPPLLLPVLGASPLSHNSLASFTSRHLTSPTFLPVPGESQISIMSFDNKCGTYIPGLDPNGNDMTEEAMVDPAFSPEQWVGEPIAKLMGKVFMMYLSATRGRTPLSFGIEFLRATLFMRFGYDVRKKPESEGSLDCWLCVRLGLPKPNPAPTPDKVSFSSWRSRAIYLYST